MRRGAVLALAAIAGCGGGGEVADAGAADGATQVTAGATDGGAAELADAAALDGADLAPLAAMPRTLAGLRVLFADEDVASVSTDSGSPGEGGGGVWAATANRVLYLPPGRSAPYSYGVADGLARGQSTWVDTYYSDSPPQTLPTRFTAVAGATAGQAIVGNEGAIADRLLVDPSTGKVIRIDNMRVTPENSQGEEYPEHLKRVVATHSIAVDLRGTFLGTAYIGGWHGFSAFHGLTGDCQCQAFEQHQHYLPGPPAQPNYCDDTPGDTSCWDGDVWGLAISPEGDVWAGDRHFVQWLPQRSTGPNTGFFDNVFAAGIDVFPGVKDEIRGLAVDGKGGVWVVSDGNGMAYLERATGAVRRIDSPSRHLRGVVLDGRGDVWAGTDGNGLIRLRPSTGEWVTYGAGQGLQSGNVHGLHFDRDGGALYVATSRGVTVYSGD